MRFDARRPVRDTIRRWVRRGARAGLPAGLLLASALVPVLRAAGPAQAAPENRVVNPSLETAGPAGVPACWEESAFGDNDHTFTLSGQAHSGTQAMRIDVTDHQSGNVKAIILENTECAPVVIAGSQYDLSVWYTSTTPDVVVTLFRHSAGGGWQYWTDLANLPVAAAYRRAEVRTPTVPAGTDRISWGLTIYGVGTLVTDDYSMVDATLPEPPPACVPGVGECAQGSWEVMPFDAPVRAMHTVVLTNGKVLLVAGSGNSEQLFDAGTFKTAVYDPVAGTFTDVPTPDDFFCAGHVQLPDGRVLILGGNLDYPAADGSYGYKGLDTSYIFDPVTERYERVNDLRAGHWYPSATVLGNGDVLSLGGLDTSSAGTVTTEYFSVAEERWLGEGEVKETNRFWGLYPAMILMQDGRLFYSGSHVFGDGLPGTGASIYDYAGRSVVDVPGLLDKNMLDQSMSVLLPPAQDQRVLTLGGGNIYTGNDAHHHSQIIDLKDPTPEYRPGPTIPPGLNANGQPQTGTQGKMYVSAVILPDGKVFETGGALHNRADPVYEASIFDPGTETFTPMAADPRPRGYHSSAVLLPDGRVMSFGDNPGDGSFDTSISMYSPPYLFKGARPQITSMATDRWAYGGAHRITVDRPVARAGLIRPAAVTHSSDPNQRFIELPMTVDGNTIDLNLTSNPNIAPPGWYMLFVTDASGVPSVARWVQVHADNPMPGPYPDPSPDPTPGPDPTPVTATTGGPASGGAGSGSTAVPQRSGYWMLAEDGAVFAFGDARHHGNAVLGAGRRAVDLAATPSRNGYWIVDSAGIVQARGDAVHRGNMNPVGLSAGESVTSISSTRTGAGYWVFTSAGRVQPFGDAVHYGDLSGLRLNGQVLDSVATPSGRGYYMVAADGGVFTFGDADFRGSMGAVRLNAPVQSLVPSPTGPGYWLVASDGGVFAFGAPFRGSTGSIRLNKPVRGMVTNGDGYLMVGADGGIFNFSNLPFHGSLGAQPPPYPVVSVAAM